MAWLELAVTVSADMQEAVEEVLSNLGALAITLGDADLDTADEEAIFEPGVGEMPLWLRVQMRVLFDADIDQQALLQGMAEHFPGIKPADISFTQVQDQAWERVWMERFKPMRFGQCLWVYPWNIEPPDDPDLAIVRLDPGLAFGTGTHPTTALCLEWLDGLELGGKTVMDYGSGSGVLAVAALKLGAKQAIAVDNDPQALLASCDNAERNQVGDCLQAYLPEDTPGVPCEVFVANILAGPLTQLAPRFADLCQAGVPLALSGILDGQQDALMDVYAEWFEHIEIAERDGWVRLSGRRKT